MTDKLEWSIREATSEDGPFIRSSWYKSCSEPKSNNDELKFRIRCLVDTSMMAKCAVACDPEDSGLIYGWSCYSEKPHCLHYVYTRQAFRRVGVAKSLWEACGEPRSHTGWSLAAEKRQVRVNREGRPWGFVYSPRLLEAVNEAYSNFLLTS